MYEYRDFKKVFENWDNHLDGDEIEVNGNKVVIVGDYNEGYNSDGECKELLIISINGETYAATRWRSSYESFLENCLNPVTKKTKVIEYWE